jgi:hypothetical protein
MVISQRGFLVLVAHFALAERISLTTVLNILQKVISYPSTAKMKGGRRNAFKSTAL